MGLSTSFKSEPKNSEQFMSGVFVNECTIVSVEPVYGGKEWQNEKYKDDVGLDITLDIGKSCFSLSFLQALPNVEPL